MDKLIANGIVPVYESENGATVDARTLHNGLNVGKDFSTWIKDRLEKYGFVEGDSYSPYLGDRSDGLPGKPKTEYALTLDCAKEIAMAESTEQGHIVRKYFIGVEKEWNSPAKLMARALVLANAELSNVMQENSVLNSKIEQDKPKVLFADSVATAKTSILIGELAKIIRQNGVDTGEKRLFEWLRQNGYLISRYGTDHNAPTQKSMDLKLFEVKETTINHSDGHVTVSKTTKVTGKGQQYFINKFLTEISA
jgi:anti-repressor protein